MIHGKVIDEKAATGATVTAENSSGNYHETRANSEFISNFWRFQNYLNYLRSVHLGDVPEPTGEFFGDGVPRTAGGYEFTPLDWGSRLQV